MLQLIQELKDDKERLSAIIKGTNVGTWEWDLSNETVLCNSQYAEMIGYTLEELMPMTTKTWRKYTHPDDLKKSDVQFEKHIDGKLDYYECELRMKHKNGDWVWILDRGQINNIDNKGKPLRISGTHQNITQRKKTELSLIESEDRYRSLVEWSPEAIVVYRNGKILYANPIAIKTVKAKSVNDLIGKSILDYIHPNYHDIILEKIKKLTKIGDVNTMSEAEFIDFDGKIIHVKIQCILINYDGKPAIQASIRDITHKKELEDLLLKVNKIVRLGAWELDLSNFMFTLSPITKDILEVSDNFETDLENAIVFFNLEKKRDEIITIMTEAMKTGKKWELELNFKTGKGNYSWMKIIGETEFINGKPTRINGSFQDVNDRKSTELALQKNMKELEDYKFALDVSTIISITDVNGKFININDNFCKISQYSKEELIGNSFTLFNSNYHSKTFVKEIFDTIYSGKVWKGIIKNKKKNGDFYWENITIVPFLDDDQIPFQYLAISFDVTNIKNAEEEIRKAKEVAEESDRLKSAFLANMSHEIRTPMNGILGFTNLLKEINHSSGEVKEYIGIIQESGVRLLSIINDIIDFSKIEAKQMKVSNTETNINEQLEYIFNFFKPEVTSKGIDFGFKKALLTNDAFITTDSEKLYAVLINLVKNAIKFCDKGSIHFGYTIKENNPTDEIEFYVTDSGVGIPNNRLQAIFDRFVQADSSDKRAFQGAGLGLSISKAYVEMLGGKIWVESEVGIGSSFYFTIPYHAKPKSETIVLKKIVEKKSEIQLKILIVEDDPISKLLLTKAISSFSKEIINVGTGIQAIETCLANPDIDLIMMDINMPEMSGYEATKKIRKFNKSVIIIAQTANAFSIDRNNAIVSGCNDYISKPINKEILLQLVQNYFA